MRAVPDSPSMDIAPHRSAIRRGLPFFALLSILGLLTLLYINRPAGVLSALSRLRFQYVLLALVLSTVDWLGGGLRLYNFVRLLSRKVGYWACVRANLGNIFLGAVTPSQTGGGPAQILVLFREGLSVPEAIMSSLMTFLSTVICLVLSAVYLFLGREIPQVSFAGGRHILRYSGVVFGLVSLLILVAFLKPEASKRILSGFHRGWFRLRRRECGGEEGRWTRGLAGLERCHEYLSLYIRKGKLRLLAGVLLSAVVFGSKWLMAYVIVKGLGLGAGIREVLVIQMALTYLLYFFPTPGASGAAELGSAALMAAVVPKGLLSVYTVLWRFLATYLSVVIGGLVLLKYIRARETMPAKSKESSQNRPPP